MCQTRSASRENIGRARELAPEHKVPFLGDWGVALLYAGLLGEADAALCEATAIAPQDSIPHVDRSAIRIREARRGEATLDQAVEHAQAAESLKPGAGAHNLACVAAQRGDREGVIEWLRFSARNGYSRDRHSLDTDADLLPLAAKPWFAELLHELFPE